jgi:hypothetical protein
VRRLLASRRRGRRRARATGIVGLPMPWSPAAGRDQRQRAE